MACRSRGSGTGGSPTAGLHFTPELLARIEAKGVSIVRLVLHVGVGTFRPVEAEEPEKHEMHSEWYRVTPEAAEAVNRARAAGGRAWAVGTTSVRTLETVADEEGRVHAGEGWTDIFIRPPYRFRAVDAIITNFHLPRSTLLMLVSAFGGYELVMRAVDRARAADLKTVVVVTGSPGSGKSVIALSLVGELARQGRTVLHATGSKAFTQTLRQVAGKGSTRTKSLFTYFNSFMTADPNSIEVLVLDEAHRIRAKSVNRYTPKGLRERARPQIEELLDVARVPVFLLDEHQVVRPGEMGTVADIKAHAAARGLPVQQVDLRGQYRAGGSDAYLDWVHRLLGLDVGGPIGWEDESTFAVDVVDSPNAMEGRLSAMLAAGVGARMTAGYCWPWSDPRSDGTLVHDVVVDGWSRPWNLKSERSVGGAPASSLWASDPAGFGQVGCVYTAQGFEYPWNGVILGPDLVWRSGAWVSRRQFSKDPDFRSKTTVDDATYDRLVRNVYKVLLTRGLVGTLLYSVDAETQEMLRAVVNPR